MLMQFVLKVADGPASVQQAPISMGRSSISLLLASSLVSPSDRSSVVNLNIS
jgi:hypothetical protein